MLSALQLAFLSHKEVLADALNTCQHVLPDSRQMQQLSFNLIHATVMPVLFAYSSCTLQVVLWL